MIQFKITSAPDRSQLGNYDHYSNTLIIGSNSSEMTLDDPNLAEHQIKITVANGNAVVENMDPTTEVKVNATTVVPGKPHPIKIRDTIRLGQSSIFLTVLDDRADISYDKEPEFRYSQMIQQEDSPANAFYLAMRFLADDPQGKFVSFNNSNNPKAPSKSPPPPLPVDSDESATRKIPPPTPNLGTTPPKLPTPPRSAPPPIPKKPNLPPKPK